MAEIEVIVGRVGRPHGVRGDISVEPRTDEPDRRFAVGARLRDEASGRAFTVSAMRWHQGRLLLRLAEITDRDAAEELRGTILVADVAAEEAAGDAEDFWDRDLVGLRVRDHTGAEVGRVIAVQHPPAQDLLEIRTDHGVRLVPFVEALVPTVDLAEGYCQLAEVTGLLDPEAAE
ncbi:ribosome maturation factor RimM [Enemella sp. A6]|uniref:ribosome maturation factor RimM n=1 Tax=Enemella sp. A6 TaxID=3440152 RepID=UPI003EBFB5A9